MFTIKSANPNRLLLRGIVAALTGITVVIIPDLSIEAVMRILGILLIIDGIVALVVAHYKEKEQKQTGFSIVPKGVIGLIIGTILVLFPTMLVNVFIFVIGFLLLMAGLSQIVNLVLGRDVVGFSWVLSIISVVALVSGIVLMARPFESAQTILVFFGIIIALYGIGEIYWSFKLRQFQRRMKPTTPEIVDAEYEEID